MWWWWWWKDTSRGNVYKYAFSCYTIVLHPLDRQKDALHYAQSACKYAERYNIGVGGRTPYLGFCYYGSERPIQYTTDQIDTNI